MAKYRKMPVVIEAWQWHRNGDIPYDNSCPISPENPSLSEGDIVRYYRRPTVPGQKQCRMCQRQMHDHGWVDTPEGGHIVCPGDWIIKGIAGEFYPCKPNIFEATYEAVEVET